MALSSFKSFASLNKLADKLTHQLAGASASRVTSGPPIALDFGVGSLKILQVASGSPPPLVAAACMETPEDLIYDHAKRLEFQLGALPKLIRHGGFKGKRAVCALPSWRVACRHMQFTKAEGVALDALVAAAVPTQFQCDPGAVVFRASEVDTGRTGGKAEVVVTAAPRDLVDRLMQGMLAAKLEPVGIHAEFTAILRAFDMTHRREGDLALNTLYLDIGTSSTNVMIAHGLSPAFARVVHVGGRTFDDAIVKQLKCTPEEATAKRRALGQTIVNAGQPGSPAGIPAPDRRQGGGGAGFSTEFLAQPAAMAGPEGTDLREPLEMLTDEVSMCLRYHASQFPERRVERAVFIGGEARSRGLCQQIARALKLPAQMADPLARVARTGKEPALGVDLAQAQPGWAVALGLCLSPTDL
ncbi:MAG: pilus assembly protein PilM [Planctomycetota bacterium]|nr:pilus assembly protein PilM [Planctomycetota bacterium]